MNRSSSSSKIGAGRPARLRDASTVGIPEANASAAALRQVGGRIGRFERGPAGRMRFVDGHNALLLANLVDVTWMVVKQAALALRDDQLVAIVGQCEAQIKVQLGWLTTRMKQAAPQALIIAK